MRCFGERGGIEERRTKIIWVMWVHFHHFTKFRGVFWTCGALQYVRWLAAPHGKFAFSNFLHFCVVLCAKKMLLCTCQRVLNPCLRVDAMCFLECHGFARRVHDGLPDDQGSLTPANAGHMRKGTFPSCLVWNTQFVVRASAHGTPRAHVYFESKVSTARKVVAVLSRTWTVATPISKTSMVRERSQIIM